MTGVFSKDNDVMSSKEVMKSLMHLVRNYIRHINKPKHGSEAVIKDPFTAAAILANMVNAVSLGEKEFSYFGITASKVLELSCKKTNPFQRAACNVNPNSWKCIFKVWISDYKKGIIGMSDNLCKNIGSFEGNPAMNGGMKFKEKLLLKEFCHKEELKNLKNLYDKDLKAITNDGVIGVLNDWISVSAERMNLDGKMPEFNLPNTNDKSAQHENAIAEWMADSIVKKKHISVKSSDALAF